MGTQQMTSLLHVLSTKDGIDKWDEFCKTIYNEEL